MSDDKPEQSEKTEMNLKSVRRAYLDLKEEKMAVIRTADADRQALMRNLQVMQEQLSVLAKEQTECRQCVSLRKENESLLLEIQQIVQHWR